MNKRDSVARGDTQDLRMIAAIMHNMPEDWAEPGPSYLDDLDETRKEQSAFMREISDHTDGSLNAALVAISRTKARADDLMQKYQALVAYAMRLREEAVSAQKISDELDIPVSEVEEIAKSPGPQFDAKMGVFAVEGDRLEFDLNITISDSLKTIHDGLCHLPTYYSGVSDDVAG